MLMERTGYPFMCRSLTPFFIVSSKRMKGAGIGWHILQKRISGGSRCREERSGHRTDVGYRVDWKTSESGMKLIHTRKVLKKHLQNLQHR